MHTLWLVLLIVSAVLLLVILISRKGSWQWLGHAVLHVVVAAFLLYFVNLIGAHYDFRIPLNIPTVATTLVLGAPGLMLLVGLKVTLF